MVAAATAVSRAMQATIESVVTETPTVKMLRMKLEPPSNFGFAPGQWVDFHVPGLQAVGGYSICSTPSQLQQTGTMDLCVKRSGHPCAQWVHAEASAGKQVSVAVGGSFTLQPDSCSKPCLFVAGGIGITALSSMLGSLVEQQQQHQQQQQPNAGPLHQPHRPFLLYSAAEPSEFALLKQLLHWQQAGAINMQLHTTRTHGLPPVLQEAINQQQQHLQQQQLQRTGAAQGIKLPRVLQGRIGSSHLAAALKQLRQGTSSSNSSDSSSGATSSECGLQDVAACVCGPPQMSEDVVQALLRLGLPHTSVHTERWW
uniref:FAD-binding FR-type domain-containing protein n=1 Tax=Tetradesmus obliquus TaxID=3088 RepID=A0A383VK06_TETOB|eukprot:jgi/Sobl393_1/15435/SZX65855.1